MGCSNCATGGGAPKGCKSNGSCGTCNTKLPIFDWLANMELPGNQEAFNIMEVRFKNGRKGFYRNVNGLELQMSDIVAVEGTPGHDIGVVSMTGELVRLQLRKKRVETDSEDIKKLYRKASQQDIEKWDEARSREDKTMYRTREMAASLKLDMKIGDVEFQGDNSKATFYYTAEDRVDFRELIKVMAEEFKIRVEMRQIGARQEAARLGGIGSCGRELCCSTWLTDFRSVNTTAARYQQLSLNPQKLAGQCGKLKCCLNYELDSYIDALKGFPDTNIKLDTVKGRASFQKMDIFSGKMWYAYFDDKNTWIQLSQADVKEIIEKNTAGDKPEGLEEYVEIVEVVEADYENVVGQDSLTRFDTKKKSNRSRNNRSKGKARNNANSSEKKENDTKENTANARGNARNNSRNNRNQNKSAQSSSGNARVQQKKTQAKPTGQKTVNTRRNQQDKTVGQEATSQRRNPRGNQRKAQGEQNTENKRQQKPTSQKITNSRNQQASTNSRQSANEEGGATSQQKTTSRRKGNPNRRRERKTQKPNE